MLGVFPRYSMMPFGLSLWPLLVCTLISMIIGMLWFSPLLFARPWMQLIGLTKDNIQNGPGAGAYVVSILTSFGIAFTLGAAFQVMAVSSPILGLITGFFLWFGMNALPMLNHAMYDVRPLKLFMISVFYDLAMIVASSLILSVWR